MHIALNYLRATGHHLPYGIMQGRNTCCVHIKDEAYGFAIITLAVRNILMIFDTLIAKKTLSVTL